MKKTRKIAAMIAAMALAVCAITPSMAFADNVNIKVQTNGSTANEVTEIKPDADNATHTYTAYQIFTGGYALKPGKTEGSTNAEDYEFKVTGLGSDANENNLLANEAFLAFSAGEGKPTVGEAIGTATGNAAAIAAAQALDGITDGSDKAKELAKILAAAITTGGTALTTDGDEFAEGYYLVKDTYTPAADGSNDAISEFILRVNSKKDTDGITIIPKKSYPEVIKKVQENADTDIGADWESGTATTLERAVTVADKWNDVADYNIGDAVPFQLYGSMPETLADYTGYYYEFSDNLATQFNRPETVTVDVEDTKLTFTWNSTSNAYELATGYLAAREASDAVTHTEYSLNGDATFLGQVETVFGEDTSYTALTTDSGKAKYVYDHWGTFVAGVDGGTAYEDADKDIYVVSSEVVDTPAVTARTEDKTTDGNCRVVWTAGSGTTPGNLAVTFENIKAYDDVTQNTIVTVNYSAVLNDTAVIGLNGQENSVKLIYSNNPNVTYTPDTEDNTDQGATHKSGNTDNTPEDKVVVFTYEIDINKIDGDTDKPLEGAKFKLSKGTKWAVVDTSTGKLTGWANTEAEGTELESDENGLFKIIGLDSGTYTLKETAPPTGYNAPANPNFTVTLTAATVNTQKYTSATYPTADTVLTNITGQINDTDMSKLDADAAANRGENGGVKGTIENHKGTVLPSTGGMGTTLFIIGGGVAAAAAGIYLISKKRAKEEEGQ